MLQCARGWVTPQCGLQAAARHRSVAWSVARSGKQRTELRIIGLPGVAGNLVYFVADAAAIRLAQ